MILKLIQILTLYFRALLEHYSSIIILASTRTEKSLLARYSLEYFLKMLVLARTRKFDTRYSTSFYTIRRGSDRNLAFLISLGKEKKEEEGEFSYGYK